MGMWTPALERRMRGMAAEQRRGLGMRGVREGDGGGEVMVRGMGARRRRGGGCGRRWRGGRWGDTGLGLMHTFPDMGTS